MKFLNLQFYLLALIDYLSQFEKIQQARCVVVRYHLQNGHLLINSTLELSFFLPQP
jgi:hypothetical protein